MSERGERREREGGRGREGEGGREREGGRGREERRGSRRREEQERTRVLIVQEKMFILSKKPSLQQPCLPLPPS